MYNYSFKWIVQRVTATILVPLTFWFVYKCILFSKINYSQLISFFNSNVNSILFLIMMSTMLIHAKMGCETIVEDYISSSALKKITIYALALVFYGAILSTVLSILSILISN